jgi:hypothetical protein
MYIPFNYFIPEDGIYIAEKYSYINFIHKKYLRSTENCLLILIQLYFAVLYCLLIKKEHNLSKENLDFSELRCERQFWNTPSKNSEYTSDFEHTWIRLVSIPHAILNKLWEHLGKESCPMAELITVSYPNDWINYDWTANCTSIKVSQKKC